MWGLKEEGYETIIINNNPETVSTDFDTSDRLYFEPLTTEDVLEIIEHEKPEGVIAQFGGQTAIKLTNPLPMPGFIYSEPRLRMWMPPRTGNALTHCWKS